MQQSHAPLNLVALAFGQVVPRPVQLPVTAQTWAARKAIRKQIINRANQLGITEQGRTEAVRVALRSLDRGDSTELAMRIAVSVLRAFQDAAPTMPTGPEAA